MDNDTIIELKERLNMKPRVKKGTLLCPNTDSLSVQGSFDSPVFKYATLKVRPCDATISAFSCASQDEINSTIVKYVGMQSHVEYNSDDGTIEVHYSTDYHSS